MIGAIRLIVFGFLALSVVYLAVSFYSRSVRREKLENWWAEENPGDADSPERDAYIEQGMIVGRGPSTGLIATALGKAEISSLRQP